MSTEILILPDTETADTLLTLLDGLKAANLCTYCAPLLVTTDDPHAAAILARFGRILDEPVPTPAPQKPKRHGGGRPKKTVAIPAETSTPEPPPAAALPALAAPLATDLAAIVRNAGKKTQKRTAPQDEPAAVTGPTLYTNPTTGTVIPFGEMKTLLATRRVVPNEEFISNRHGRVRVVARGDKLVLARV